MSAKTHALTTAVGLVSGPLIAFSAVPPVAGEVVLVMAPDSFQRERLVVEAGGELIGPRQAVFGSLAISEDPNFAALLKSSGAWFVVDGRTFARLCGVEV